MTLTFQANGQVLIDDDFTDGMDGWVYQESCSCGYELHLSETDPDDGVAPPSLTWQKANICDCECQNDVWCEGGQECFGCGACQSYEGYFHKTLQLPVNTTSFTLSFDWRSSSNLDWSFVTNSAMHIEDEAGNTIYQEDLVMGGTYDTGWQQFETTIELAECGEWPEITIFLDVKDYWWDTPWCNKNWWDNIVLSVEQSDDLIASFSVDPQTGTGIGSQATFFNQSTGASTFLWNFFDLGTSSQQTPVLEFNDSGKFPICLYVWDEIGCMDSSCTIYTIFEEFDFFIPNVVSPNGDGVNDQFYISVSGIDPDYFLLEIYNRWGQMMFQADHPNEKWNGRNLTGAYEVSDGVYFFRLWIRGFASTETREITGTVTVFR